MKIKFKVQPYQTNAVDSVVDCFAGQPHPFRLVRVAQIEAILAKTRDVERIKAGLTRER